MGRTRISTRTRTRPNRNRITFNVGGRIFQTTSTTLANAGRNSFFGALFDDDWNLCLPNNSTPIFLDRNSDCFAVILDLLRTGSLFLPPHLPEKLLFQEAHFYGLSDHVRSARWGPFDGNRLRLTESVSGNAPGDGTAIRGGPDGGCCVAHGCIVHVYDWAFEEHAPIHLDYQIVNDVGWLDSQNVVVSACERLGRGDGGMGLFNASSGSLRHRFQVFHENQPKSFTAGALGFSRHDRKIFSSCKGRSNEYGVGVWDQSTGQQLDFFYEPLGWSLGDADRLQWLPGSGCLLVATLFPRKDHCYISLLDFRAPKSMVWAWSDVHNSMMGEMVDDQKRVRDAIAMEFDEGSTTTSSNSSTICVVNEFEDLGFMDLRSSSSATNSTTIRWSSRSKLIISNSNKTSVVEDEPCYPKLGFHNGQLFSSMNDSISVFSGPEWVLTSRLRRGVGGPICDFSIGGDRLFALHSQENVFDVWETPPPSPLAL